MIRGPPRSTRSDTLLPDTTLVRPAAARQGLTPLRKGGRGGTQRLGRGRRAVAVARFRANGRRVIVKARVVRHKGMRFRAAPLAKHISYLERDGVTRDGRDASLFDAQGDAARSEEHTSELQSLMRISYAV